jgi:hypothetical protein
MRAKIEYVEENGRRYCIRNGRRFEVVSAPELVVPKAKRKDFKAQFVQIPMRWIEALDQAKSSGVTCRLAHTILVEAFQREVIGGEIVLSAHMTGISSGTIRRRAAKELERLGLIQLKRHGKQALRVIIMG